MLNSHRALSFVPLFGIYPLLYDDCLVRGHRGFNADVFLLFVVLVIGGSYGYTSRGCCGMLFKSYNNGNLRSVQYRLKFLIGSGYVNSFYYKGRCRYKISIHAEKMIAKSLGKESLRDMANYVKSCLKD